MASPSSDPRSWPSSPFRRRTSRGARNCVSAGAENHAVDVPPRPSPRGRDRPLAKISTPQGGPAPRDPSGSLLAVSERVRVGAMCPGCGKESATTPTGLCERCTIEAARDRYIAEDNRLASLRELEWTERTRRIDADVATLRQQRHRLIERCRPRTPAPESSTDPFQIATEAPTRLTHLRNALERAGAAPPRSDDVRDLEEAIRRLAWGPD